MVGRTVAATALAVAVALVLAGVAVAVAVNGGSRHGTTTPVGSSPPAVRALRILLVGDSMAGTLGVGLAAEAGRSGVTLVNASRGGCGIGVAWDGGWAQGVLIPVAPTYPCRSSAELLRYWRSMLDSYRPDVVIYAARVDTLAQEVAPPSPARMTSILDPPFQAYLENAMTEAVGALSSTGAHVVLATSAPTRINLVGNSNDDPRRWAIYERIIRSIAAGSRGTAAVFDLGRFFGGNGPQPTFELDAPSGVRWRCSDGIHFSAAGGALVAPALFEAARSVAGPLGPLAAGTPAIPAGVADQPWPTYAKERLALGCPP